MWDLPGPGIKPVSPALAGGFLTTVPPGKSQDLSVLIHWYFKLCYQKSGAGRGGGMTEQIPVNPEPTRYIALDIQILRIEDICHVGLPSAGMNAISFSFSELLYVK